jgi:endonuclease/exonuclease/phosphatase family metal-dependent hydrolase
MRVLTWNVNGRVGAALARQLSAVLEREPDVIALQEVTRRSYPGWSEALMPAGYSVLSTRELVAMPYPPPGTEGYPSPPFPPGYRHQLRRKNFNVLASRYPIAALRGLSFDDADEAAFAFPEKHLAGRILVDGTEVDVHNTHLPPGVSRGMIKVHHFEAIRRRVDGSAQRPRVLCGDFNAPGRENSDGPLFHTWGGWPGAEDQERWFEAETRLLTNPSMPDVYRAVHEGAEVFPASHHTGPKRTPHRYDYIFASKELRPESCDYLTAWLEPSDERKRLSDHAAVEADLHALD